MDVTLEQLLQRAVEANASDIHLKVGAPPVMRIGGELRRMENLPPLKPADTAGYAQSIFTQKAAIEFKEYSEADFAYGRQDLGRFRVSAFRQRGSVSMVLRRVTPGVPAMDRLGLPPVVRKLAAESKGLVLVTGPSGSGRTTTLASIIEHINATRPVSIVTVEDPIEILFPDKMAVVAQREVGVDTASFADAVYRAMRQDVDVIMISQITDQDGARAAVAAAETGHLVLAAMHTADPVDTVSRLVNLFPPAEQKTARTQIATHLRGVISQRLVDESDTIGKVLATEIMITNSRIQEHVLADAAAEAYLDTMKESEFFGMQTFDQSFLSLVKQHRVPIGTALSHVRNTHEFRAKAMEAGISV
jgi:twitching motility protein PilT